MVFVRVFQLAGGFYMVLLKPFFRWVFTHYCFSCMAKFCFFVHLREFGSKDSKGF